MIGSLTAGLFNAPLALHLRQQPATAGAMLRALGLAEAEQPHQEGAAFGQGPEREPHRYYEVLNGVAIIPVMGVLLQRLGPWSYGCATGYDGIRMNIAQALVDPEVAAIALHVNSPGGEVAGCFDLVDAIHAARGIKPMHAILAEHAYSAAYAIASATDRIVVPRTGGTGSIGVIAVHAEFSRLLEEEGIAVTIFQHGARKADGSPYQPLPDPARERFQRDIDAMGELFIATVARNRGLAAETIRGMQAATYRGEEGVRLGLADAAMAPDAAFAKLLAKLG
jgi:signal peptide peptidase SppA